MFELGNPFLEMGDFAVLHRIGAWFWPAGLRIQ
jgi:hypothetical protein